MLGWRWAELGCRSEALCGWARLPRRLDGLGCCWGQWQGQAAAALCGATLRGQRNAAMRKDAWAGAGFSDSMMCDVWSALLGEAMLVGCGLLGWAIDDAQRNDSWAGLNKAGV